MTALIFDLARLFRREATADPCAQEGCAPPRAFAHEVSPTDSERRHLLAEARAIEEEADEDVFSPLRTKVSG